MKVNDMNIGGINHIAIIVSNYSISKKFYVEVLGFSVIQEVYREERDSYLLQLSLHGEYVLELFTFPHSPKRLSNPEALGLRHLAFTVDNIENYIDYLNRNLIQVEEVRVDPLTGNKYTFFKDPDGLPIEVVETLADGV